MARKTRQRATTPRTMPAICHIEIPAPDLKKAIAFYTNVFGWTVEQPPLMAGHYALWRGEGRTGGFDAHAKPAPVKRPGVGLYLAVPSIPRALKQIERAGGKVLEKKTAIGGGFGHYAVFIDPNGNRMNVWSLK